MTMYTYDTEFLEDGSTIELISIGIVCEDGREFYAVNASMDSGRVVSDPWLFANVWPHLPTDPSGLWLDYDSPLVMPKSAIAEGVREFLTSRDSPELWAYFAAYDHVALAQLWGKMIDLPPGIPMHTYDLKQEMDRLGVVKEEIAAQVLDQPEHDALADARWNMAMLRHLREVRGDRP